MDLLILDNIKDTIDKLIAESKWEELDQLLIKQDFSPKTPVVLLLTYLKETKSVADKLPYRKLFIDKLRDSINLRSQQFLKAIEEFA